MDPDTRRLVLFAGGLAVILSILIATSAVVGHRRTDVPVIAADPRPIRIKPDNPGGMKIDGADSDLFSGGLDNKNVLLAATAENPETMALSDLDSPQPHVTDTTRQAGVRPTNDPSTGAPVPLAQPGSLMADSPQAPVQQPSAIMLVPPLLPQPKTVVAATTPPMTRTTIAKSSASEAVKPTASLAESHTVAPKHQTIVQLGALTTEEAAHNEWQLLVKRMPSLLSGHQPSYSRTDKDGHTFWRVRTSGFVDLAQARGFCDHVRAKGGGCSATEF